MNLVRRNEDTHIDEILMAMQEISIRFFAAVYCIDSKETASHGASVKCFDSSAKFSKSCLKGYPLPAIIDNDSAHYQNWERGTTLIQFTDASMVIEIYIDDNRGHYIRMYSEDKYQEVKRTILAYNDSKTRMDNGQAMLDGGKREREDPSMVQ